MIQKTLYTGGGASLSPVFGEGRTESEYVRLIADEGRAITNGTIVAACADVRKTDVPGWTDCDEMEELTDTEALAIIMGGGV